MGNNLITGRLTFSLARPVAIILLIGKISRLSIGINTSTHVSTALISTNHFSGSGRAIGLVCVCRSAAWAISFEQNELWPRYFACYSILTLSGSSSKVKVIGQTSGHRSKTATLSGGFLVKSKLVLIYIRQETYRQVYSFTPYHNISNTYDPCSITKLHVSTCFPCLEFSLSFAYWCLDDEVERGKNSCLVTSTLEQRNKSPQPVCRLTVIMIFVIKSKLNWIMLIHKWLHQLQHSRPLHINTCVRNIVELDVIVKCKVLSTSVVYVMWIGNFYFDFITLLFLLWMRCLQLLLPCLFNVVMSMLNQLQKI